MQAIEQSSLINQDALIQLIKSEVDKEVAKQSFEPRTAGLTQQVRKDYFHGKGIEWIRTFIFDRYPETNEANGGWVTNPRNQFTVKQQQSGLNLLESGLMIMNLRLIGMKSYQLKGDERVEEIQQICQ